MNPRLKSMPWCQCIIHWTDTKKRGIFAQYMNISIPASCNESWGDLEDGMWADNWQIPAHLFSVCILLWGWMYLTGILLLAHDISLKSEARRWGCSSFPGCLFLSILQVFVISRGTPGSVALIWVAFQVCEDRWWCTYRGTAGGVAGTLRLGHAQVTWKKTEIINSAYVQIDSFILTSCW